MNKGGGEGLRQGALRCETAFGRGPPLPLTAGAGKGYGGFGERGWRTVNGPKVLVPPIPQDKKLKILLFRGCLFFCFLGFLSLINILTGLIPAFTIPWTPFAQRKPISLIISRKTIDAHVSHVFRVVFFLHPTLVRRRPNKPRKQKYPKKYCCSPILFKEVFNHV